MTTKISSYLQQKKKWLWIIGSPIAVIILFLVAWSIEYEKTISTDELPPTAQQFLATYYPDNTVVLAKKKLDELCTTYKATYSDGSKVEFFRNGEWKKIETRMQAIPQEIIPSQIRTYVEQTFPGTIITEIDHKRGKYNVELNNSIELTFDDKRFALTEYDD